MPTLAPARPCCLHEERSRTAALAWQRLEYKSDGCSTSHAAPDLLERLDMLGKCDARASQRRRDDSRAQVRRHDGTHDVSTCWLDPHALVLIAASLPSRNRRCTSQRESHSGSSWMQPPKAQVLLFSSVCRMALIALQFVVHRRHATARSSPAARRPVPLFCNSQASCRAGEFEWSVLAPTPAS